MTAAAGRARRADAERNARRLLRAARELFDEQGPAAPLDEIARRAGVGNATLYRHFPTRGDLLVAVYSDEVAALCDQGAALLLDPEPGEAFHTWLQAFALHAATRRTLAFAGTESDGERRTALFERWHAALTATAERLLTRAQRAGGVRADLTATEVLVLANAVAASAAGPAQARRLLSIARHGLDTPPAPPGAE